jgi:hypothetical protein
MSTAIKTLWPAQMDRGLVYLPNHSEETRLSNEEEEEVANDVTLIDIVTKPLCQRKYASILQL